MRIITAPPPVAEEVIDRLAAKVFMKSIEILGGLRNLINYRNLTWLPSLAEASYAIVLKEKAFKTKAEIARILGLSETTVANILGADPEKVMRRITEGEKVDEHIAGGLAKKAFQEVIAEEGKEMEKIVEEGITTVKAVGGPDWALKTLIAIKGLDFPVSKEALQERLKGLLIKGKPAEELLDKLPYPIESPAKLLHYLSEAAES